MRNKFDVPLGLDQSVALGNTLSHDLGGLHGPGGGQPSIQAQLDRLKDLQKTFSWGQAQALSETPPIVPGIGQQQRESGSGKSASLLPPGPSSPHDSQAPALRNDGANISNGSVPISHQGGSSGQSLPGAPEPNMLYNNADPLALPDLSDLPLDLPDMFGELEVPTLEQLIDDIGAAEAELMASTGLPMALKTAGGGNGGASGSGGLLRAHTLPAPSSLPLPPSNRNTKNSNTRIRLHARRNTTTGRQASLPEDGVYHQPTTGSDGSGLSGGSARRKRKGSIETQADRQSQGSEGLAAGGVGGAAPTRGGSAAAARDPAIDFCHTPLPKKIEIDFILDDDALLDRVGNHTSAFAGLSSFPFSGTPGNCTPRTSFDLSPATSLPNRHWLSPAAAIHAVHASRPGDEDVIKWLMYGK